MERYPESKLASRPQGLDPARYYEQTLEQRRLQEERVAIRARLKREYQLELQDPAVERWMFARNYNILPNARLTPKVCLRGALSFAGPLLFLYVVAGWDRARKEREFKEGKDDNPFSFTL